MTPAEREHVKSKKAAAVAAERKRGEARTSRAVKIAVAKATKNLTTEVWQRASRATLASIYKNCPDEAMVIYIGQLLMGVGKRQLTTGENAAREAALKIAHEHIERVGLGSFISVEYEHDVDNALPQVRAAL